MKAKINSLDDGTVLIDIETESGLEVALLRVFFAQTYYATTPAKVSRYGPTIAQFAAVGRPLSKESNVAPGDANASAVPPEGVAPR